jgi:phage terminase large subunit GpA-like protein
MDTPRTFINPVVGLPFAPPSERISADGLMARAEPLPEWPPWVGAFTIGVDVQKDRYELLPVGFGADQRIALMPSEQVYGDLEGPDTLRDLLEALTKPRGGLLPEAIALDTGHRNDVVWRIVDTLRARRVQAFGVKGEAHVRSIIAPPAVKGRKGVRNPWQIGTNHVKDFIEARLRADPDSSRGVLFSDQITPEMFAQLTAEERKTEWKQGQRKTVWVLRPGMRNEMLDMLGYAIGALHARGARFIVGLGQLADSRTAAPVQAPAPAPAPTIDPVLAAIQRATRRPAAQRGFLSKR